MKNKGAFFVLLAAILWGVIGIFIKNLERLHVNSLNIVFMRCFLTALFLGLYLLFFGRDKLKISARDIPFFAANGILSVVMFTFCYYKTIELSTLSSAATLMYTAPVFVMIISVLFFKEKLTLKKVSALLLSFAGCAFVSGIVGTAVRVQTAAIVFGLLTGFGYSLYTIFGSRLVARNYSTFTIVFYTFLFAFIGSLIIIIINRDTGLVTYPPEAWCWASLLAIISTVAPYFFYTLGLKSMDISKAPIVATVEPVTATLLGLFYKESITLFGAIGIVLVLSSMIIVNLRDKTGNNSPN